MSEDLPPLNRPRRPARPDADELDTETESISVLVTPDPTRVEAASPVDASSFDALIAARRFSEAAALITRSIKELERAPSDPASIRRLAELRRVAARLWQHDLGRLDRALESWQRAFQLEPARTDSLTAAREIYASLGKDEMVAQLFDAELAVVPDDPASSPRRAVLELELGRLHARHGRSGEAALHLERALAADPRSGPAREALAEVYAAPEYVGKPEQARAGELFVALGKVAADPDVAIQYLRRAIGVDPYGATGSAELADALAAAERWDELDRHYRDRLAIVEADDERARLLARRIELHDRELRDREVIKRSLEELAALSPQPAPLLLRLRELYAADEDWRLYAALIERGLADLEAEPDRQIADLLELATITRERLGDRDRAAELLHQVLTIDGGNEEALARYSDHFRERRDWRGLADLTEFAIETARDGGASSEELVRRLEELAQLAEVRLGDVERASATWHRVLELEPSAARAHEALRRLTSRAKMWESLVGMLEQEAQAAATPTARAEALRRIAQVFRERSVNPLRAIQLYEEVLALFPEDEPALKALAELYEREGDDAGLAATIRRQLDLDWRKLQGELEAQGNAGAEPKDWPVARRVERLTALRRLGVMYEQKLNDLDGAVFAGSGVLEILPGDRDALDRLERMLEKAGDTARLEQTLEYHAASASGPAERAKVQRRLARLAADRSDEVAAMERWEAVARTLPSDVEACDALAQLYDRHQRWDALAAVLERSTMGGKPPEPGSPQAAKRAADIKRFAQVVDDKLDDPPRAIRAWRKLLELLPRERDALAALARLYEEGGQWRELADILDRQVPLYAASDPTRAADIAFRRARLLEERLGAPADAARALEAIIESLDPANLGAHSALRRLVEARGDFETAVRLLEREMVLLEEADERIDRGLEIGLLARDRLGDPTRALMAFERVLELRPDHEEALAAAAELYAQVGDHPRHVEALERRLAHTAGEHERRGLMMRIAQVTADKLGQPAAAFAWLRGAHAEAPDAATLAELRRAAEQHGLWIELGMVFDDERARLAREAGATDGRLDGLDLRRAPLDRAAYVAACREVAIIAERRLGDPARALVALGHALRVTPAAELLIEAERVAGEGDTDELWRLLDGCFEPVLEAADAERRVALHLGRARLREERLGDPAAAAEDLLRAFAHGPERDDVRVAIEALAERTGRYDDLLAVEAARFARADDLPARLASLRRRARLVEDKLGDLPQAFRLHLQAFLLAPDDDETSAELWRLARAIGSYAPADRSPRPEAPAAHVESGGGTVVAPLIIESTRPRPPDADATQELVLSDLVALRDRTGPIANPDRTQPLEADDLLELRRGRSDKGDPTVELSNRDLIEAIGALRAPPPTPAKRPPPPPTGKRPPPPRPVEARRPALPGLRPIVERPRAAPRLPDRSFATPWEELVGAIQLLPAPDRASALKLRYRAAEVWEHGAGDVGHAFDVLAEALRMAGGDGEPRARLHRLASDHDQWDRLAELYENAAEDAASPEEAATLFLEVAEIRATQGRARDTEAILRRVLGMRPDDAGARERLEALYRGDGRWVDLAASLEERTDPRLGAAVPIAARPALLRELAAIYRDRLGQKHDAIDALERLRGLSPDDLELLRELAALYGELGRWNKVIEVLGRVADVAEGQPEAREALRRIGQINEVNLELPDRAIDAYRELAERWANDPDAFAALDRLYEQHARWRDLEDILRRRAALERSPDTRAELLRRRAHVLGDWLGAPDEAASALRHARTMRPDDPVLADELVTALAKAGKTREAAAVLEGRISSLIDAKAAAGDIAALYLRLSSLRVDALKDPEGARAALERALALVPDHPSALAQLARLAEHQKDPRMFAEARLREAEVLTDVDQQVAALLDAGMALRDQCDDRPAARAAFERVLALRPFHAAATWALAGLVEQSGDLERAAEILQDRLEASTLDSVERAQVYTQLAALSRQAGIEAAAERRLDEALAIQPDHLPAILARADLLAERGRDEELADFLEKVIPTLEAKPADVRSELYRRLALALDRLGGAEEAYRILLEADRLNRGSLPVKLALGENRFRERRWREAALHLGALAGHAQAERHPAEVAEGLHHAALAEIRSLRPEKAEALYLRAIELKPNYVPALQALAELATEKGDRARALEMQTRRASATEDPAERLRLFETLGDAALRDLRDELRAKLCYEAAVNAAVPLESKHLGLLDKLLVRQDAAGDAAGAGRTAELMASFATTAPERAGWLKTAASSYLEAGQEDRAQAAAARAVEADPYDLTAVTIVSDLATRRGDHATTAEVLGRALHGREHHDDVTATRQAALWARLGAARERRGDRRGAVAALQSAIATFPGSPGAMAARRQLIELWRDDAERADVLLEFRRTLAADTLALEDVVAYARALRDRGEADAGRVALELAAALGSAPEPDDVTFLGRHPAREMGDDEAYRGLLDADARTRLVADPDDDPVGPILGALRDAAALLWPSIDEAFVRCGVSGAQRVAATSELPAAAMWTRIARAVDAPATVLYATSAPGSPDVQVVCVSPPVVVLGHRLAGGALSRLETRFVLARAAELIRPERIVAVGLPTAEVAALLAAIVRTFGKGDARADDERLRTTLPVKVRSQLERMVAAARGQSLDIERHVAACQRAADRLGLIVAGDIDVALRLAGGQRDGGPRGRHLIELVLREGYLAARATLGIGAIR